MGNVKGLIIPDFKMPENMKVKHTHASIILGLFSKIDSKNSTVVELGCGNCVVLVLVAKLNPSVKHLIGVEINKNYCDFAQEVIKLNDLSDRIEVLNADVKDVPDLIGYESADCIMFNPPFHNDGKTSKTADRFLERNVDSFEEFTSSAKKILKYGHKFFTITSPKNVLMDFSILGKNKMVPKSITPIYGKKEVDSKLIFTEGIKGGKLSGFKVKAPIFLNEWQ
jgi:tRNA1Val (adenine37-N6)-methyltransferase